MGSQNVCIIDDTKNPSGYDSGLKYVTTELQ
jgi:hypothetical protein